MEERAQVNRVIEESVPGKQVTIAHVIASPVPLSMQLFCKVKIMI